MESVRDVVLESLKQIHFRVNKLAAELALAQATSELPGEPGHSFSGDLYHLSHGYDQILAFLVNDGQTILERDYWDDRLEFDDSTLDDDPVFLSLSDEQWDALKAYTAAIFAEMEGVLAATPAEALTEPIDGADSNQPLWALQINYLLVSSASHAGELQAMHGIVTGKRPEHH